MPRVQVAFPLLGSGTRDDPYTAPVPTFDGGDTDLASGLFIATVTVQDADQLAALQALGAGTITDKTIKLGNLTKADPQQVRDVFAKTHPQWRARF